MVTCDLCQDRFADEEILDHLAVIHPELYGQAQRWSDGEPAIVNMTLTPEDFTQEGEVQ